LSRQIPVPPQATSPPCEAQHRSRHGDTVVLTRSGTGDQQLGLRAPLPPASSSSQLCLCRAEQRGELHSGAGTVTNGYFMVPTRKPRTGANSTASFNEAGAVVNNVIFLIHI